VKLDKDMYDTASALTLFRFLKNLRVYEMWEHLEEVLRKDLPKSIKVVRFDLDGTHSK
jgi:hypothetical protein